MLLIQILAQASSSSTEKSILDNILQYGSLGLVVVGFLFGYIWPKPSVDRIIKDKEAAEAARDGLVQSYQDKVLPMLKEIDSKIIPALENLSEVVKDLEHEVRDLNMRGGGQQ